MVNKIRDELTALLDELNIDAYKIDTENKKLDITYKEDYDLFFPVLDLKPEITDLSKPYVAYDTHIYAEYKGWQILGHRFNHKPK